MSLGIRADNDKFRELIIFFADESEGDRTFGATKLNKLLFYADFVAYLKFGKPITGQRYQKLENGPAPRALLPIVSEMELDGNVTRVSRDYHGKSQNRLIAKREPDLDKFSGSEVQLMHQTVKEFWGKNASEMSALSHDFVGWQLAELGEDIPYEVALVGDESPSEETVKQGLKLAKIAEDCLAEHEKDNSKTKFHARTK